MEDYKSIIENTFSGRVLYGSFSIKNGFHFSSSDKKVTIPIEDCPNIFKKYVESLNEDILDAKRDLDAASLAMHQLNSPLISFDKYFCAFEKRKEIRKKLSNARRYVRNKFGLNDRLIDFNFVDTGYTLDYVLMHDKEKIMEKVGNFFKE